MVPDPLDESEDLLDSPIQPRSGQRNNRTAGQGTKLPLVFWCSRQHREGHSRVHGNLSYLRNFFKRTGGGGIHITSTFLSIFT